MSRLRIGRAGLLNLGLAVALAAVVLGAYTAIGAAAPTAATTSRTVQVTQGELTATVTGSGNLASSRTASLSFGASGTVTDLDDGVGDKVSKGDELASIDTASAERNLAAAKAKLASAEATYSETASGTNTSTSSTGSGGSGGTSSVSAAKLGVSAAEAGVSAAKKQLTNDTKTQNAMVAEAQKAYTAGTGTQAQLLAAKGTRDQVLAKDKQGILQAEQSLASARSTLSDARSSSTDSSSSTTATAAQLASAAVDISDAEASVQDAKDALAATKIVAPFSGTVLSVSGDVGDTVSSGTSSSSSGTSSSSSSSSSTTTGTGGTGSTGSTGSSSSGSSSAFITMASTTKLEVTANIPEADIGDIKVGQTVAITLSASSETATGEVSLVSPEGTTSSNVVQYPVTITVDDPPKAARIGSTASVRITTGSASDAILVQSSAITTTGNRSIVTLVKNGTPTPTVVETGLVGTTQTQVISGLAVGDQVQLPTTTTSSGTGTQGGLPGFGGGGGAAGGLGR